MAANKSFLSNDKYGYDFVVTTTQESRNSGLLKYMDTINQPTSYLGFLVDDDANSAFQISLHDFKARTGGMDPFETPNYKGVKL
jgi:hypothetical protein